MRHSQLFDIMATHIQHCHHSHPREKQHICLQPTWSALAQERENFWELYRLFNLQHLREGGFDFRDFARQLPKILALFLVVAFGSSLDVAAIQADTPGQLDYNHELKTVGEICMPASVMNCACTISVGAEGGPPAVCKAAEPACQLRIHHKAECKLQSLQQTVHCWCWDPPGHFAGTVRPAFKYSMQLWLHKL